jgi:MYXO-CTERM domain-containing protein
MMLALLHATPSAHSHPDQMAVAVLFAAAVVGASWMLQRRRS